MECLCCILLFVVFEYVHVCFDRKKKKKKKFKK